MDTIGRYEHGCMLQVSDREGQGVRCIRRGRFAERQNDPHHLSDLLFVRPTISGDRSLDASRCVLEHRELGATTHHQRHTARVSELRRCLRVLREEQTLDARVGRRELVDHGLELNLECRQSQMQRTVPEDDHSVRDVREPGAALVHDAPTEAPRPGIDPEDDQSSAIRCISSSVMSKSE